MVKNKMVISFSGGRTSAFMTKWLLENRSDEYEFIVVFANTGHEKEATLEFVNRCDKEWGFNTVWVEAVINAKGTKSKIVDFNSAYRNRLKNGVDPFESMIAKYGIPNMANPHCSRELKHNTIRAYLRSIGLKKRDCIVALGIRSDEPKRLNWIKAKNENLIYFAQFGKVTKETVNKFWSQQKFDLQLKSYQGNCILCWKKSNRKLYTIILEGIASQDDEILAEIEWLKHVHLTYGRYIPKSRIKQDKGQMVTMFRGNKNIDDLIEESFGFTEFAQDESKLIETALQMSLWNEELDGNFGCVESCEAF